MTTHELALAVLQRYTEVYGIPPGIDLTVRMMRCLNDGYQLQMSDICGIPFISIQRTSPDQPPPCHGTIEIYPPQG